VQFASQHFASCAQLQRLLRALPSGAERLRLLATFWPRVVDREGLADVVAGLPAGQQAELMRRLGHRHVWASLGARPHGLHFSLDLGVPEQRDLAKEVGLGLGACSSAAAQQRSSAAAQPGKAAACLAG
jgi:hypothetical protein